MGPRGGAGLRVQLRFFALARDLAGTAGAVLELPEGATVGEAWDRILADYPGLVRYRDEFMVAVNRRFAQDDHRLEDGDELAVIPPVSGGGWSEAGPGGQARAGGVPAAVTCEVTEAVLDPLAALEAVRHPGAGAVTVFVGTVRELTGATRTLEIEYEAYPEMAREQLAALAEEACRRWDLRRVYVVHRQGRLHPGEDSVVIAVSAPHRADAFAACRYIIDRIKETVPVWKKETTSEGSRWVGREG